MACPVVVEVLALVQSLWACARSAASLFWSVSRVDSSLVSVLWSAVTVALWPLVVPREGEGVVVVVVVVDDGVEVWVLAGAAAEELVSLSSSSTSLASSAATVDWADETDSLRAVVSSVPSVCPAVTTCPGVTEMVAT